ncbi:MAG: diguanylate cyclase, partial [Betaproteobacteria bacterium]
MTKELRASEQRWNFALEGAGDGVWDWNLQTRETLNSRRLKEIVGFDSDHETIDRWEQRIHPDDMPQFRAAMQIYLTSAPGDSDTCVAEYRIRMTDEYWKWILSRGMVVERDEEGRSSRIIGTLTDISARKLMEEQVRQLAFHDPLTNLPNRRMLNDRMTQAMAASKRSGCYGAVMFLDLDNFKSLNDAHGHEVGDLLLLEAAARLKGCVRETDTVARFGGDEFVVMLSELNTDSGVSTSQTEIVAEKIRRRLSEPYYLTAKHEEQLNITVEHHCTASIGVALFISDEAGQDDIFKWADAAMYAAKESGRDSVKFAPETTCQFQGGGSISTNFVQLTWRPVYNSGNATIDEQHRGLFDRANQLLSAILSKHSADDISAVVDALIRDIVRHFEDEEAIITAAGFPGAAEHATIHSELVDSAVILVDRFQAGTLDLGELFQFLAQDVVALHMLGSDRDYFSYLERNLH